MIYIVRFRDTAKVGVAKEKEIEATDFKFEGTTLIFVRETPMSGIIGTGKEIKSIAAYKEFISVEEKPREKSK